MGRLNQPTCLPLPPPSIDFHPVHAQGNDVTRPIVEIEYCTQCRWLLRAAWTAQELLLTFENDLGGVTLVPGQGGIFKIRIDGDTLWSRASEGRFPGLREIKKRLRDYIAPARPLGHSDRP